MRRLATHPVDDEFRAWLGVWCYRLNAIVVFVHGTDGLAQPLFLVLPRGARC